MAVLLFLLLAATAPGIAFADCIDYKDYLHIVAGADLPGKALGIAVSGSYAYVAGGGAGLQVVDITNPTSPVSVGSMDTPGDAQGLAISGAYAYVADDSSGLQVIDITNPLLPALVGSLDTPGAAKGVAVSGSFAYVADDSSGLQVIDISNPASPVILDVGLDGWGNIYVADTTTP